jgi:Tn3 transposase DDE domain
VTSWDELVRATASAKAVSSARDDDNLIAYLGQQYVRIRRFSVPFLATLSFEGSSQNALLLDAVTQLQEAWKGRRSTAQPWITKALRLTDRRWRKEIIATDGAIDRKMLELFLIVELKNRIAAGEVWVKGSRAYRALDEHMIPQATFAIIKAEARIPVAIPVDVETYLEQKSQVLDRKLREAAHRLEKGRGDTRIGAKGLRVPAVRDTESEAAVTFAKRIAAIMPPIRLTDLVADIDRMTSFSSLFEHLQTGRPPSNLRVFFAALIAEATNLGFSKRRWPAQELPDANCNRSRSGISGKRPSPWRSPDWWTPSMPLRSQPPSDRKLFLLPTASISTLGMAVKSPAASMAGTAPIRLSSSIPTSPAAMLPSM